MPRYTLLLASILGISSLESYPHTTAAEPRAMTMTAVETQITDRPAGHILTNINVWSPDGNWIVYDTRSDAAGEKFDGSTIEVVNIESKEVREVFRARNGARCGAATFDPKHNRVVFIAGPENPTEDWQYGPFHRQGVIVDLDRQYAVTPLDARDVTPPFTPGALRGGTHVHVFDGDGGWISFTYEDHVLATLDASGATIPHDANSRNIGVCVPARAVHVPKTHPRNHDGSMFTVLVTRTVNDPRPGSDDISRACEESWLGTQGYVRPDGKRQRRALAFQGKVTTADGQAISEVFIVDLPEDVMQAGDGPLAGTETRLPSPPLGMRQRRLTNSAQRKYPGLQGPRHWLRSSPDGSRIAFLMRDDAGIVQIWTVSPNGSEPRQLTRNSFDVASSFSWSPDGKSIAYVADNSIFISEAVSGKATRVTPRSTDASAPRPEACVVSPDGRRIAFVRPVGREGETHNQVFIVSLDGRAVKVESSQSPSRRTQ